MREVRNFNFSQRKVRIFIYYLFFEIFLSFEIPNSPIHLDLLIWYGLSPPVCKDFPLPLQFSISLTPPLCVTYHPLHSPSPLPVFLYLFQSSATDNATNRGTPYQLINTNLLPIAWFDSNRFCPIIEDRSKSSVTGHVQIVILFIALSLLNPDKISPE